MLEEKDGHFIFFGKEVKPRKTVIIQAEQVNNFLIIREDSFKHEGSNIYSLDSEHHLKWKAELPMEGDVFSNNFNIHGSTISCSTWNGIKCTLNISDGKILEKKLEK